MQVTNVTSDGFAEVYQTTPIEEAEWKEELIKAKIDLLKTGSDLLLLTSAIDTLCFHQYENITALLSEISLQASIEKQVMLTTSTLVKRKETGGYTVTQQDYPPQFG